MKVMTASLSFQNIKFQHKFGSTDWRLKSKNSGSHYIAQVSASFFNQSCTYGICALIKKHWSKPWQFSWQVSVPFWCLLSNFTLLMRSKQDVSNIRNPIQKRFPQKPSGGLANSRSHILDYAHYAAKQKENVYRNIEILEALLGF